MKSGREMGGNDGGAPAPGGKDSGVLAPGGEQARLRRYLEKVTEDLRATRRRVQDLQSRAQEPIAIVGMSCRFPGGVRSPSELWRLVADGADAISACPTDRGFDLALIHDSDPDRPGASCVAEGGFLHDATEFDAGFFGIGPYEAQLMDPQQRLLLEGCWEALEDAGIDPQRLRGAPVGVFAGVMYHEYAWGRGHESVGLGGHVPTVAPGSAASGRVAYAFGLQGPAISVDTACSSSLVALHLACQALRAGDCSMALAGGVSVFCTPRAFVEFTRYRGLSPDGRCKSFAEAADGVGFSEGIGVLAVERLSEAQAQGHPILAVIRGSAVNQDGASNGLTAPNGPAQERVIREALRTAGLTPQDVELVEAHGTGTTLGDPIEAGALLAVYGQGRAAPLKLGSIKSNIGHPQAAAGVAGVIKAVMAMREGVLPETLHVDRRSSRIDWGAGEIELLTQAQPWEANGRPRRAAVSSFGASGTNAHLILEEAPAPAPQGRGGEAGPFSGPLLLPVCARTPEALREQASRLISRIEADPELSPADLSFSLATTRSAFECRGVVVVAGRAQMLEGLSVLARGQECPLLIRGAARVEHAPILLFGGQGAQHVRMAAGLLEASSSFAERIDACERALSPYVDWSLREVLADTEGRWLEQLEIVQPVLFAVMVSLAGLWQELGVQPAGVVGHSQGEIAAAHVSGGLSLEDAALVTARRAQAIVKLTGKGAMLSVSLPADQLAPRLERFGGRLSVAAVNGPAAVLVSGDAGAVADLLTDCEQAGVRAQRIAVDYAAHSSQIDALEDELLEAFAPIAPRSGEIPFHSTVTGEVLDTAELNASYWYRNLRQTVRMEPVLRLLLRQGRRAFIEATPHPVLGFHLRETIEQALPDPSQAVVIESLRRGEPDAQRFALSLAKAHAHGVKIDWNALLAGADAKRISLPTYPFQRRRYWLSPAQDSGEADADGPQGADVGDSPDSAAPPAARLASLPEREREPAALELVLGHLATVLGRDSSLDVDPDLPFQELGLESIGALELHDRLAAATAQKLALTVVFDHPSPAALARHICERAGGAAEKVISPVASGAAASDAHDPIAAASAAAASATAAYAAGEPIAIVGMSCRYPGGASSPELLWRLLAEGRDGISAFPADRIEGLAALGERGLGGERPCHGGFLDDLADFDAGFFGVAPREATAIDPQQRLMLEGAWEALEDAGIDPHSLRGSQTGVFVGAAAGGEYAMLLVLAAAAAAGSVIAGTSSSVIAGRVSYTLGLQGPAIAVDTACSSSLVAIHLACQSLRGGECSLALVGGVTAISTPAGLGDLAASGALSPDGRCKAFAEAADGTGFSEGVGVLALERLSRARDLDHRILAVVRGSAINQDGASNGLVAPNGTAQARVIAQALANARLAPSEVDAVEAHGTGTMLGDPIEAGALLATYGQDRQAPLWLGSIKSNIGHAAAAAGVAGVIKMVMAMREGALPKTLHVDRPSSKIDWAGGRVELLTEQVPWAANGRPRRAGVSSFGMSGTNAHLILEEAPQPAVLPREVAAQEAGGCDGQRVEQARIAPPGIAPPGIAPPGIAPPGIAPPGIAPPGIALPGVVPLAISAKTDAALRQMAERLRSHLQLHPELELASVGRTLVSARATFSRRAVALGEDRDGLLDALGAIAGGATHADVVRGEARAIRGTAFVFSGYGSQWPGMALELLDRSPKFAAAMRECEEALEPHLDWSVDDVLRGADGAPTLDRGDVCSTVLFAMAVSLARLWQACGVQPSVVVGHSQGELAAAHIAGGLSLQDAAMVAALRVKMLRRLEGKGAMASVALPAEELVTRLRRWEQRIGIAVMNGPNASVVSGDTAPVQELLAECARDGVQAKMAFPGKAASHSHQVEELREEMLERFASIAPRSGQIPFHSTVTGGPLDTACLDAQYWYRNARETVLLEPVVRGVIQSGAHALLEVSPHPVLGFALGETLETVDGAGRLAVLGTLRRKQGGVRRFARSLAEAHVAGVSVDWSSCFYGALAETVPLPTYPFQRRRYWPQATAAAADFAVGSFGAEPREARAIDSQEEAAAQDGAAAHEAPSLRERVAGLTGAQREETALDLVLEQIATVLGFLSTAEIDRDRALQEMGFDSLAVVELRNHIALASGLQVPMPALANMPTPVGIARSLLAQLSSGSEANAREGDPLAETAPATALVSMLGHACEDGRVEDFLDVLSAAARLRPAFDDATALKQIPRAARLRDRADSPCLVLTPSLGPMSGPHEYVRLAKGLDGGWNVLALPLPGFLSGGPLPASLRALAQALAASISAAHIGNAFVLGGHSTGGWVAHVLAAHLCAEGIPPAALVLIDTYDPASPALDRLAPLVLMAAHEAGAHAPGTDDARLTAMAAYSDLFAGWAPPSLPVPSIVLRASAARIDGSEGLAYISGAASDVSVDVPGNHFTVMSEHAASTAKAIEDSIELIRAEALARSSG